MSIVNGYIHIDNRLIIFGSFALFIGDNVLKKGKYSEFNLILYIIGGKVKVFGRKVVYKLCM